MGVDPSHSLAMKTVSIDEFEYLVMICGVCLRQGPQQAEYFITILQRSAGQFTHDKRVAQHFLSR